MRKIILYLLLLIMAGCGGKNNEPQLASSYQDNAILIKATAPKDLNLYDHQKHTLKIAIVQVAKVEDVQKQIVTSEGLSKLLNGDSESETGNNPLNKNKKIHIQTFFIAPGATQTFTLARMAGAKTILVVAGYYNLIPAQVVRVYEIPVFQNWRPITFWEITRRMGRICIFLQLGSQAINYTDSTSKQTTSQSIK